MVRGDTGRKLGAQSGGSGHGEMWEERCQVGQKSVCFFSVKQTFFILTNNLFDLDSLSMSAISAIGFSWVGARGAAKPLPMHKTAPQQRVIWRKYS